jgi:Tol biopolymer transport system component
MMAYRAARRGRNMRLGPALAAVASAVLGAAFLGTRAMTVVQQPDARPASTRSDLTIGAPESTSFFGLTPQFAVSPNGQQVVFVASAQGGAPALWLRSLASTTARPLPGTEQASYPFWSPDNQLVGFFASGKLKKIQITSGLPIALCDAPTGRGGAWSDDNIIVFASGIGDPLRKVPASGGVPAPVTVVDVPRENSHRWPQFLPDGRHILFWAGAGTGPAQLKIASLDSRDVSPLAPADANGAYAAGYVFFGNRNALMAQPFDAQTLQKKGEPIRVVEPVSGDAGSSFASFSVSTAGTLLYTRGSARPLNLTWFDRTGKTIASVGEPGQYTNVNLGPDGKRLAVSLTAGSPPNRDVWIVDLDRGGQSRLTADPAVDATPIWSPDGSEIVFSSQRAGPYQMYRKPSTGSAPSEKEELLLKADAANIATDWSPDGRSIAYTRAGSGTGLDLWILPLSGDQQPVPFLQTSASEDNAAFSPDGRWIAYQSNESGRDEVYVRPFPAASGQFQISRNGGTQPRWRGDGKELFFLAPDGSILAATVNATAQFEFDGPRTLLPAAMTLVIRHAYTVTKDGQRFLMPVLDQRNPSVITVVVNWPATAVK